MSAKKVSSASQFSVITLLQDICVPTESWFEVVRDLIRMEMRAVSRTYGTILFNDSGFPYSETR